MQISRAAPRSEKPAGQWEIHAAKANYESPPYRFQLGCYCRRSELRQDSVTELTSRSSFDEKFALGKMLLPPKALRDFRQAVKGKTFLQVALDLPALLKLKDFGHGK